MYKRDKGVLPVGTCTVVVVVVVGEVLMNNTQYLPKVLNNTGNNFIFNFFF
jgi:hypothetical protein